MAGLIIVNATVRCCRNTGAGAAGNVNATPIPGSSGPTVAPQIVRSPSLTLTAPSSNAGTIYFSTSGTAVTATARERTLVKLTAGQSWTFTGVPRGGAGYHDVAFGTGYLYMHASATGQRGVVTYYKWD